MNVFPLLNGCRVVHEEVALYLGQLTANGCVRKWPISPKLVCCTCAVIDWWFIYLSHKVKLNVPHESV